MNESIKGSQSKEQVPLIEWVAISSRTIDFRTNEVSYNYFDLGTYHKEKGTQSGHRFQLRNKIWTAPAYNDMRYNMVNVRRNKK
jgi:hypothetical protein